MISDATIELMEINGLDNRSGWEYRALFDHAEEMEAVLVVERERVIKEALQIVYELTQKEPQLVVGYLQAQLGLSKPIEQVRKELKAKPK